MTQEIKQRIEQIRNGEVPEGYKQTKVGIIPNEWEVKRLKDKFVRIIRKNTEGNTNVLTISAKYGLINQEDFFNKAIASEDKTNYYLLNKGEFAYNKSYSNGYPFGAIKPLIKYENGIVSPLYICFAAKKENKSNMYFQQYFECGKLNSEIHSFAQEGARNHGLLNLSVNDFFNSYIVLPSDREQKTIAEILATQDKVIELKEKLLEEKVKQKKYLMQLLLTEKKRIGGFCEKWKTEALGNLFDERTETNCQDLELLAITGSKGVVPRSQLELKDNSSDDKSKYRKICIGDIGYNTMRMWQGVSAYSNYEGIVSPAYTILKSSKKINAKFFAYLFKMTEIIFLFYRYSQGLVDDTRNLKYQSFKLINVKYPEEIREQNKIVEILEKADLEIELINRDLESEKQKKKSLMQLLLTGIVRVKL